MHSILHHLLFLSNSLVGFFLSLLLLCRLSVVGCWLLLLLLLLAMPYSLHFLLIFAVVIILWYVFFLRERIMNCLCCFPPFISCCYFIIFIPSSQYVGLSFNPVIRHRIRICLLIFILLFWSLCCKYILQINLRLSFNSNSFCTTWILNAVSLSIRQLTFISLSYYYTFFL